jgi:hypothetical protein
MVNRVNKKGALGILAVLLLLIIGVVIGVVAVGLMDDSGSSYSDSYDYGNDYSDSYDSYDSYDNYDDSEDYYGNDYVRTGYGESYGEDAYDQDPGFQDYYSDTPDGYDGQELSGSRCGYLDEPCCEGEIARDAWGSLYMTNECFEGLECRGGYCVEGPEYESAPRGGW